MAELLLVLDSEEIPARMQATAGRELVSQLSTALSGLNPRNAKAFWGPRRIAASVEIDMEIPASTRSERGPRESAPEQALAGFLRKHDATRDELVAENGSWVLNRAVPPVRAADRVAEVVPDILWRFSWPKSMRWGAGSYFTWVRPLRGIICLLDGTPVPLTLARDGDDAHGLSSGVLTTGHRFMAPDPFEVSSARQWQETLKSRYVLVDADERAERIVAGIADMAAKADLDVVADAGLVDEVAGLTEWPVPLMGRIDDTFMDLPPEVMQVSMRINQRYFALRDRTGQAAPYFAFVANMTFADDGALTIAGNERVLRARFADARHFWDLDRKIALIDRVGALNAVTFHAKLGTQGARVERFEALAREVAMAMGLSDAEIADATRAGRLAKADLTTGMVGEFPELQGVMGGYYARHDGESDAVARAVAEHYQPRGLNDEIPRAPVSVAVALADRLDLLASFFLIDETPSGSGDPYGLRRAALGVIRTIRDNGLRFDLERLFATALDRVAAQIGQKAGHDKRQELMAFVAERLRVQLRNEGERHDVLSATLAGGLDGDLVRLLTRTAALAAMIETEDGRNLLAAGKRAANILRIENKKDGPHDGAPDPSLYTQDEERTLSAALDEAAATSERALEDERFTDAMRAVAALRPTLDSFFDKVTVNDSDPLRRINRLHLLAHMSRTLGRIADFGQIEG